MDIADFNKLHGAPKDDGVESLYKFKSFDEKRPQRLTEIFEHGLLYIPTVEQLNDPWECQATLEMPVTLPEIAAAKDRLAKTARRQGMKKKVAAALAENYLADSERFAESLKMAIKNATRDIRIFSFAAERDNALLWVHYANSHKGLCIEFSSETVVYRLAHRVNYQASYPSFKYPHDQYDALSAIVTKSIDWEYEREYRTFNVPDSATSLELEEGKFQLNDAAVSRVYFGALMPPEHQSQIIESIQKGPFTPELFKARLRTDAYNLDYDKID